MILSVVNLSSTLDRAIVSLPGSNNSLVIASIAILAAENWFKFFLTFSAAKFSSTSYELSFNLASASRNPYFDRPPWNSTKNALALNSSLSHTTFPEISPPNKAPVIGSRCFALIPTCSKSSRSNAPPPTPPLPPIDSPDALNNFSS